MIEVWTNSLKGNDKLVGFGNGVIYKANPKTYEEVEALAANMRKGVFDTTKVWEISTRRCREIRMQDGKSFIEIYWGKDGEEELRITDEYLKHKIFEVIKAGASHLNYTVEKWSIFKAGRKPLIAMAVIVALFAWTLFYAIEAQSGMVYYLEDGRYDSITGIVLGIASLGLTNVIAIFSFLIGLAVFAFIRKTRKIPMMYRLLAQ